VFAVTNQAFSSSGRKIRRETAVNWLASGMNVLPEEIGMRNFTRAYNCTALIYEFRKPESSEAVLNDPSTISAADHLMKARIIDALKRK
jgi:hypothetical protein